jgi:hypothetical protein
VRDAGKFLRKELFCDVTMLTEDGVVLYVM